MDFWDLTKLLVRRWMIALPLLLLSAALIVLTVGRVRPEYVATAYAQPIPPVVTATAPGQATPDQRNPWLGLGLEALGKAAIVTVTDQAVVDELMADGYSGSFTIEVGSGSPLVTFEVVGTSEQQARETAQQVVARFSRSVATLQTASGVAPQDAITTRRLDLGANVHESNANVKRAIVAVAAAALLMTVAVTIGVDALLRKRRRRHEGEVAATVSPTTPPSGQASRSATAGSTTKTRPQPSGGVRAGVGLTAAVPAGAGGDGRPAGVAVEHQTLSHAATIVDASGREEESGSVPGPPDDATIVLPVAVPANDHRPRRRKQQKSPGRGRAKA